MDNGFGSQDGLFGNFGEILKDFAGSVKDGGMSFASAAAGISMGANIFGNSVDKLKEFSQSNDFFATVLSSFRQGIKIFGLAELATTIVNLTTSIYSVRRDLSRDLGIVGKERERSLDILNKQTELTLRFGIGLSSNFEMFKALSKEFKDFTIPLRLGNLVAESSIISERFQLTADQTSAIVANLVKFGGKSVAELREFFETVEGTSVKELVPFTMVAQNISNASKEMYRFNLQSRSGVQNFRKMSVWATKLGIEMTTLIGATDKLRTFQPAMELAAQFGRFGVPISPLQVMGAARTNDFTFVAERLLSAIAAQGATSKGQLTSIGFDMASVLGDSIGMSTDEIQHAIQIMTTQNISAQEAMADYNDNLEKSLSWQQSLDSIVKKLLWGFNIVASKAMPALDRGISSIAKTAKQMSPAIREFANGFLAFMGIVNATIVPALLFIVKGIGLIFKGLDKAFGGWLPKILGGMLAALTTLVILRIGGQAVGNVVKGVGRAPARFMDWFFNRSKGDAGAINQGVGKTFERAGSVGKRGKTFGGGKTTMLGDAIKKMSPLKMVAMSKLLLSTGLAMISFASSVLILAFAFKKFNEVEPESIAKGFAAIGSMVGSLFLMSKFINVFSKDALFAIPVMFAMAGATWALGSAMQTFNKIEWKQLGLAAVTLVGLTAAMVGIGAIIGTGFGGAAIGLGMVGVLGMAAAIASLGLAMQTFIPVVTPMLAGLNGLHEFLANISDLPLLKLGAGLMLIGSGLGGIGLASSVLGFASNMMSSDRSNATDKIISNTNRLVSIDLRLHELSVAMHKMIAAMTTREERQPVTLETKVELDGRTLIKQVTDHLVTTKWKPAG